VPLHDHYCQWCNEYEERHVSVEDLDKPQRHRCGLAMERVYTKFPMAFIRPDVNYTSPVDGRPITNYQEHLEELARNDSVVYEPGIKQDQERNARLREEALDRAVDETVDREIATMPAAKREKLVAELEGGLTAEPARVTPPQVSYRDA
jgi:hypothetical protein